jgi:hypothetical protein
MRHSPLPGVDSARWRSDLVDPHSPQCPTENTTKGAHSRPSKIRKSMNHIESSNIIKYIHYVYIYILKDMKEIKYWIILKDILKYLKYIQGYRNISNHHERVRETHQRHVDRVGSVERPQPEVGHQKPSPRVAQPLPALSRDSDLEPHTVYVAQESQQLWTSCLVLFGFPTIAFVLRQNRRWSEVKGFLRTTTVTTGSSSNLILCSTEPQAVRSLKRWNLTMQGMSDLGKPPASLGSVSLDSQGQNSWSHDACGIPTLNKQTRTSQRRRILPSPPHCCQTGKSGTPRARRHCAHCDGQWNVIFCWPSCLRHWRVLQILSSALEKGFSKNGWTISHNFTFRGSV